MTTHVLVVNENTFKCHLEYMFAATGGKEPENDKQIITVKKILNAELHPSLEKVCVGMLADGWRVRRGDFVIFYVVTGNDYGKFYGIFQTIADGVLICNNGNYLKQKLNKTLPFRIQIKPYKVYSEGVSEWEALDEIKELQAPCQMLWSLIYRKLKGKRGNTMITLYEATRLIFLISRKNNNISLNSKDFTYDGYKICTSNSHYSYSHSDLPINILPRLINKNLLGQKFEIYLQLYIIQNLGLGTNKSLDKVLDITKDSMEWLGNEVSCGVGMQRIDIMFSKRISDVEHILFPIELKAIQIEAYNINQIRRYVEWIEQYCIPNTASAIQPVLICKETPEANIPIEIQEEINLFNSEKHGFPLKFIEYTITSTDIIFKERNYNK